jgi:ketopantoate reductase
VQFINGAIARQGLETGIATPVNNTLTSLVEALQETANEYIS